MTPVVAMTFSVIALSAVSGWQLCFRMPEPKTYPIYGHRRTTIRGRYRVKLNLRRHRYTSGFL